MRCSVVSSRRRQQSLQRMEQETRRREEKIVEKDRQECDGRRLIAGSEGRTELAVEISRSSPLAGGDRADVVGGVGEQERSVRGQSCGGWRWSRC
jgi:hypothetical protein